MSWTPEACALCTSPTCTQPKRHAGECDGDTPSYAQTVTALAHEYRTAAPMLETEFSRLNVRLYTAAAEARIGWDVADQDFADEIEAGPVVR